MDNEAKKERSIREKVLDEVALDKTCILDYLEIVKQEYQMERGKRQSFESRANIVITILTALFVFVFEKIKISVILKQMLVEPCTFLDIIQILSGIGVYLGFAVALVFALKTISVRRCKNFNVQTINELKMGAVRMEGLIILIEQYKEIVIGHREVNEKIAKALKLSYLCVVFTMIAIIFYINL